MEDGEGRCENNREMSVERFQRYVAKGQVCVVPNTAGEQIVFDTWDLASIDRA